MDFLALLDEIRILAQNGLEYTDDAFDRRRYERLLEIVTESYGDTLRLPPSEVHARFSRELGHITPKVGAEVAIFDADGRILLIRRTDDVPVWHEYHERLARAATAAWMRLRSGRAMKGSGER